MTTRADVDGWVENGRANKATHLIVVCDSFSYEDYPVYAFGDSDLREKKVKYCGSNMQYIHEVITL